MRRGPLDLIPLLSTCPTARPESLRPNRAIKWGGLFGTTQRTIRAGTSQRAGQRSIDYTIGHSRNIP